jgi:hypothetical protein
MTYFDIEAYSPKLFCFGMKIWATSETLAVSDFTKEYLRYSGGKLPKKINCKEIKEELTNERSILRTVG